MSGIFYILIIVSAILIILSIELALIESSLLNIASAVLLFIIALKIGAEGLQPYLILIGYEEVSYSLLKAKNSLSLLVAPALYFVALLLPRGTAANRSWHYVAGAFVLFAIFAVLNFFGLTIDSHQYAQGITQTWSTALDIQVDYNAFYIVIQALGMLFAAFSLYLIIRKYQRAELIYQKKQIRYFLSAVGLYLLFEHFFILSSGHLSYFARYPIYALAIILAAIMYGYSIINYRFFNLRKTAFRLAKEFLVSMLILSPIALFFLLIREWAMNLNPWIFLALAIGSLALFFKLHQALLNLLSRFLKFDNQNKDYSSVLFENIGSARNLEELARKSINALLNSINCSNADFLIFRMEKKAFVVSYSATGKSYSVPLNEPFLKNFQPDIEMYERELVSIDPRFQNIKEEAQNYFRHYGAEIVIPLYFEQELPVLIHISRKMDNTAFTSRDFALLSAFRNVLFMQLNSIILFEKDREARQTLRELDLASEIQSSVFQNELPVFKHFDVYMYQNPVTQVSGDYSYVTRISEDRLGFIIADVSGKGISASLIAMVIHAAVNSQDLSRVNPGEMLSRINKLMTSNIHIGGVTRIVTFATIFCAVLDRRKKTLTYSNAGHLPLIAMDCETGEIDELGHNGKPVGIFQQEKYPDAHYQFDSKMQFFAYTDGITEAMNSNEEEYGEERLIDIMKQHSCLPPKELTEKVLESVLDFSGEMEQRDDITIVSVKV